MTLSSEPGVPTKRVAAFAAELSGAFADLGTFLPLVVGMFAVSRLDPVGVLFGFGVFALATAAIYRRPVPAQPMKVVAALVIGGLLGPEAVAATGLLLGIVLILLVVTGAISALARRVPESVMIGVQLGVGLYLILAGARLAAGDWPVGLATLGFLLALQYTRLKPGASFIVIMLVTSWSLMRGDVEAPHLVFALHWPSLVLPDLEAFWASARLALVPQLGLTLTNAVLITAAIAANLFPQDKARITPRRLGLSTGLLNLALAPLGAFPMCHGAGGLVVQYRFGARTWLAPLIFGSTCLALAIFLGPGALDLLTFVPVAAVGALLVPAGFDLAWGKRLKAARGSVLVVILATGIICVMVNVAVGFLVGLILDAARVHWTDRRGKTA